MIAFGQPARWFTALGVGLAGVMVISIGLGIGYPPAPPEPEYEGQPLSYYLANLSYGDLRREREAVETIRLLGSNAVPHLIRILNQRESHLAALRDWARRQPWAHWAGVYPVVSLTTRQRHALMACQALGVVAAPAVPSLLPFTSDPDLATHAVRALALAGPQTVPALTNLLRSGILDARVEAAGDLRYFGPRADVTPALLPALHDPHPIVRARAADTLGVLRCQPVTVVPALLERLSDPQPEVQRAAINSLGWFGLEAQAAVPTLLRLAQQSADAETIRCLEHALAQLGWNPTPSAEEAPVAAEDLRSAP